MTFKSFLNEDISLVKKLKKLESKVANAVEFIYQTLSKGNKVFICGNGGSAADSEHLSAEFLVRLRPKINRKPFPVLSLTQNTSTITACSNDYRFEDLFKRNLQALSKSEDLLICLSTSGNSKNIKNAILFAKKNNIKTLGFFGNKKGICHGLVDCEIQIPSNNVAKIQESYMKLCHFIFAQVEDKLI